VVYVVEEALDVEEENTALEVGAVSKGYVV